MSTRTETAKREVPETPFAYPHVFVLAVVEGPAHDAVHRVDRAETLVGRGDDVDLRIADDQVSKRHLALRCDAGACHVVDVGRTNGTTVNGRPLRAGVAQRLHHLDVIAVGANKLMFLSGRHQEPK